MLTASQKISSFAADFEDHHLAAGQRHKIRRALLDTIACAFSGANDPASQAVKQYVSGHRSDAESTILTTGTRVPVEFAALVNGVEAHVLDYDDVTSPLRGHPSVAIFPALLAIAEAMQLHLRQVETAYAVGFEVLCKIARAVATGHYKKGWHSTSSLGCLGATVAAAHLIKLDKGQISHAIGLAVAQSAGTRENFGTMAKSFQAGQCAAIAIRSVQLARLGFTSAAASIEGEQGFAKLYTDHGDIVSEINKLALNATEIEESGFEIKKYPMCYAAHRALDGILDLRSETDLRLDDVSAMEITASNQALVPLIHHRPQSSLEAKFSIEYAVAAALEDGHVNLQSFTDAKVRRPKVQAAFETIRSSQSSGSVFPRWVEIRADLKSGVQHFRRVETLRGSADMPLPDQDLVDKAVDCFEFSALLEEARELAEFVLHHADLSIAELVCRINRARKRSGHAQ